MLTKYPDLAKVNEISKLDNTEIQTRLEQRDIDIATWFFKVLSKLPQPLGAEIFSGIKHAVKQELKDKSPRLTDETIDNFLENIKKEFEM